MKNDTIQYLRYMCLFCIQPQKSDLKKTQFKEYMSTICERNSGLKMHYYPLDSLDHSHEKK